MYADDSTLYSAASSCEDLTKVPNRELGILACDPQLKLAMPVVPIEEVKITKLLRVTLDGLLTLSEHIENIISKMGKGICMIWKCFSYLTSSTLNQVIQSLVLSHLQYCPVIWSSVKKKEINKLQLAQNQAARLALHCSVRTNVVLCFCFFITF